VPEPSTLALFCGALLGLIVLYLSSGEDGTAPCTGKVGLPPAGGKCGPTRKLRAIFGIGLLGQIGPAITSPLTGNLSCKAYPASVLAS